MPPTEIAEGMLCLSRHDACPWQEALQAAELSWTGLQYTCLKILHLYCKVFEREDVIEMIIRKTCKSCGCDRLQHSVYHEELGSVRDRLGLRESRINHSSYDAPPGLTAKQSELYWSSLAERAPTSVGGATGLAAWRAWRTRALASQLPKQDLSLAHCRHIDPVHHKQYEDFVAARNEIALDIGVAGQHHGGSIECLGCTKSIRNGGITVQAPRIGDDAFFHPSCFACAECDEVLVELAYCALDGRLFCVRHYAERLKPRCHSCDELFKSCPGAISPTENPLTFTPGALALTSVCDISAMGLVLSAVIAYAGINDAVDCLKHLLSGVLPDTEPDFTDLVQYYTRLLHKAQTTPDDWTTACGQGYLNLTEEDGQLKTAAIKYYHGYAPDSTAILFSTKISSFGDSIEDNVQPNGGSDYRNDRYSPAKTKTIVTNSSNSFSINNRSKSPGPDRVAPGSIDAEPERVADDSERDTEDTEKLTWNYTPLRPEIPTPEIQFQSYEDDKPGFFTDDYLRSLDGIKHRPLQRSDPSGRRRSFKKRSSSSTSSKDSRASRDEELKMFTSLEEAEMLAAQPLGSAPNLSAHSHSRSRSRTPKQDHWSMEADDDRAREAKKLDSFDEEPKEVIEDEVEDFWGNSGD